MPRLCLEHDSLQRMADYFEQWSLGRGGTVLPLMVDNTRKKPYGVLARRPGGKAKYCFGETLLGAYRAAVRHNHS